MEEPKPKPFLFLSFPHLVVLLAVGKVSELDLENALFFFSCHRQLIWPENDEEIGVAVRRIMGTLWCIKEDAPDYKDLDITSDNVRKLFEKVRQAAVTAEYSGRCNWRWPNAPLHLRQMEQFLFYHGVPKFVPDHGPSRYVDSGTIEKIREAVGDRFKVIWSDTWTW